MTLRPALIAGAVAALGLGLYIWRKGSVSNAAQGLTSGAVGAVGGAASGVVLGIGEAIGVPRTDESKCAAALREGRLWAASFECPASDFVGGAVDAWRGEQTATTGAIVTPRAAPRDSVGLIPGIGGLVGIPRTDETKCASALREGRLLDASFDCPASDFLSGAFQRLRM